MDGAAQVFKRQLGRVTSGARHKLQPQTVVKMFIGAAEEHQSGVGAYAGIVGSIPGSRLLGIGGGH